MYIYDMYICRGSMCILSYTYIYARQTYICTCSAESICIKRDLLIWQKRPITRHAKAYIYARHTYICTCSGTCAQGFNMHTYKRANICTAAYIHMYAHMYAASIHMYALTLCLCICRPCRTYRMCSLAIECVLLL